MNLRFVVPTLLASSLILGCQQQKPSPDIETDSSASEVTATADNNKSSEGEPEAKPETNSEVEASTNQHAKSAQSGINAKDVTFKKVPFDYKLPKNVAEKCDDSEDRPEGAIGCPSIDIALVDVEPKWIEDVINLEITDDNSSKYIKFRRGLDAFAQSQLEDESPFGYSEMVEPKQLAPHNNVAQFSLLSDVYLGGAHGMPNISYLLFDMDMETQIGLYDVLDDPEDKFFDLVHAQFTKYLADEMGIVTPEQIADYEESWPFTLSEEFYFGKEGLVLVYQPYELGSYAQGFIELTVPYKSLKGVVRPEYL